VTEIQREPPGSKTPLDQLCPCLATKSAGPEAREFAAYPAAALSCSSRFRTSATCGCSTGSALAHSSTKLP
jgi:hypothetical protein